MLPEDEISSIATENSKYRPSKPAKSRVETNGRSSLSENSLSEESDRKQPKKEKVKKQNKNKRESKSKEKVLPNTKSNSQVTGKGKVIDVYV